jgi:predicted HicB family RNase H-like nuclease
MKLKSAKRRLKTFPLEMEDNLHKALKYKAIESDQTLHSYIIETLAAKVQEDPAHYVVSNRKAANSTERKK